MSLLLAACGGSGSTTTSSTASAEKSREQRFVQLAKCLRAGFAAVWAETDELCLVILARRQPVASDLRFITLSLKMVTDLERIGDLAVNICERALDLDEGYDKLLQKEAGSAGAS